MGIKAFVQKGRGKPGLILPAGAVARINESSDRSALVRAAERTAKAVAKPVVEPKAEPPAPVVVKSEPKAEPLVPEPAEAPAPKVEPDTPLSDDDATVPDAKAPNLNDLTQISGVGPSLQRRLRSFGFSSIEKLAEADPAILNEVHGSKGRGAAWVAEAKKLLSP